MDIRFERVYSRSVLLASLERCSAYVLLGDDDEASREYFKGILSGCVIGICSEGHGISPSGLVHEKSLSAWIGYNSKVAKVDIRRCRIVCLVELDSVFFCIVEQAQDASVIVIHELGASRISNTGKVLWTCTTDVVTDYTDRGDFLSLQTDEGEVRIEKERGLILC